MLLVNPTNKYVLNPIWWMESLLLYTYSRDLARSHVVWLFWSWAGCSTLTMYYLNSSKNKQKTTKSMQSLILIVHMDPLCVLRLLQCESDKRFCTLLCKIVFFWAGYKVHWIYPNKPFSRCLWDCEIPTNTLKYTW